MMKENIQNLWLLRNWKWLIPLLFLIFFASTFLSSIRNEISSFIGVYTDPAIYENALIKANENVEVMEKLGKLEPIGFISKIEGVYKYSNNNNSILVSVSVKGVKENGRLDISADRVEKKWVYSKIGIRIKKTNEKIKILN